LVIRRPRSTAFDVSHCAQVVPDRRAGAHSRFIIYLKAIKQPFKPALDLRGVQQKERICGAFQGGLRPMSWLTGW